MATITLRSTKGSPLTTSEIDSNFSNLNTDKIEDITGESIKDLNDVYSSMSPTDGQLLTFDTTNGWQAEDAPISLPSQTGNSGKYLTTDGSNSSWATLTESDISDLQTYLTGNQTITLSGDASGSGTTSIAVTVADDSHNHSSSSGDFSVGGDLSVTGITTSTANSVTASGASTTIDMTASNFHVITMNASTTFTFSNLADAVTASGTFIIKQDATGGRSFTLPASCKTPVGGASIVQSTGANTTSILSYIVVSSTEVLVNYVGNFA